MRSAFDFSPLFRSTIGFDRLPSLMDSALRVDEASLGYPPYNIEKIGEDAYQIAMAVAGFAEFDLEVETKEQMLLISGRKPDAGDDRSYLHRGIAARHFSRSFQLAEHVKVTGARLENGLLFIDLVREIPEAMRPRRIEIATNGQAAVTGKSKKVERLEAKVA